VTVDPENQRQLTSVRGRVARIERRVQRWHPVEDPPETMNDVEVRFEDVESRVDAVEARLEAVEADTAAAEA